MATIKVAGGQFSLNGAGQLRRLAPVAIGVGSAGMKEATYRTQEVRHIYAFQYIL
ncbi:hypothetical protein ACIBBE_24785 [Streptomyces sp. NPDC051644]|uniref:hypothetical protein n=1 Tax=Streptomyces sp. NPDC051644 TaxID=3365666 RepID=UPI0037A3853E